MDNFPTVIRVLILTYLPLSDVRKLTQYITKENYRHIKELYFHKVQYNKMLRAKLHFNNDWKMLFDRIVEINTREYQNIRFEDTICPHLGYSCDKCREKSLENNVIYEIEFYIELALSEGYDIEKVKEHLNILKTKSFNIFNKILDNADNILKEYIN